MSNLVPGQRVSKEWQYKKDKTQKPCWSEPKQNHKIQNFPYLVFLAPPKVCLLAEEHQPGPRLHRNPSVENFFHPTGEALQRVQCPWCPAGCLSHVRHEWQSLPRARAFSILSWLPPARGTCAALPYLPLTRGVETHQNHPNSPGVMGVPHPKSYLNPPVPGKGN